MSDSNILEKIWAYITEIMVYNDPQDPFQNNIYLS